MSAIVRFGLAILVAAGIYACRHSELDPSATTKNPAVGRWQAEISSPGGQRQQCLMEIGAMGQIVYSDSCPMPLTGQQATITTAPNGALCAEPLRHWQRQWHIHDHGRHHLGDGRGISYRGPQAYDDPNRPRRRYRMDPQLVRGPHA